MLWLPVVIRERNIITLWIIIITILYMIDFAIFFYDSSYLRLYYA
jgi:hypothetical protein